MCVCVRLCAARPRTFLSIWLCCAENTHVKRKTHTYTHTLEYAICIHVNPLSRVCGGVGNRRQANTIRIPATAHRHSRKSSSQTRTREHRYRAFYRVREDSVPRRRKQQQRHERKTFAMGAAACADCATVVRFVPIMVAYVCVCVRSFVRAPDEHAIRA